MNSFRALRLLALAASLLLTSGVRGQETSLIGQSRAAVTAQLGSPQSTLHRGDREILVFANGDRVELIGEEVVAHHSGSEGTVITRDGTHYRSGADGTLTPERVEEVAPPPAPEDAPATIVAPQSGEAAEVPATTPPADDTVLGGLYEPVANAPLPEDAKDLPGVADLNPERLKEKFGLEESEPPPSWAKPVSSLIGMTARFAIMMVVLQIALKWVGQPYYMPDVLKISALYVVIRDGLHALGGLGGMWEMVPLFRIDEIVGLLALSLLLFKSEITRNGLTAMKIAFATHMVTLGLMLAVGLAMTFGLAMLY